MKKIITLGAVLVLLLGAISPAMAGDDNKGPVNLTVTVPNVVGVRLTEAIKVLTAAGLNRETQLSDRDGEARVVIRQDPVAGTRVARGSVVKIYGQLVSADEKGRVTIPARP